MIIDNKQIIPVDIIKIVIEFISSETLKSRPSKH